MSSDPSARQLCESGPPSLTGAVLVNLDRVDANPVLEGIEAAPLRRGRGYVAARTVSVDGGDSQCRDSKGRGDGRRYWSC